MVRPTDAYGEQLSLGPRHSAEDGAGRAALEAYLELDPSAPPPVPPRRRFIDYPRAGRRGWTRWVPSWRLVLSTGLLSVGSMTALFLVLYMRTTLPSTGNADTTFQATIVKDARGNEIGRFAAQNRVDVKLSQVPEVVRDAVLSAEDRTFYSNGGVSVPGLVRAAVNNLRGGPVQGGSTITQQYVKVKYSSVTDRSYGRKLNEFFVSLKVARELSKDEILEGYLNIIYFGHGCYGIEAASKYYFNVDVDKLSVAQAAWLAAIIKGPEYYPVASASPATKAALVARWEYVLDGMVAQNWLKADVRAKIKYPKPALTRTAGSSSAGDQTQYELGMVREEMKRRFGISESDLQRNGYQITTTFNSRLIADAKTSIRNVLGAQRTWPSRTQVAIATVDSQTGAVVSMYAGDGTRQNNGITQDIVQAGSTFKPFALVAALEGKRDAGDCTPKRPDDTSLSLRSRFDASSPQKFDGLDQPVSNDEPGGSGQKDLVEATAESINTVFVGLNKEIGPRHTAAVARCAGLRSPDTRITEKGLNNVLGVDSPHPLDMAAAYATLAADGAYHAPYVIAQLKLGDVEQKPKAGADAGNGQVFDKDVIADATFAMQAVVQYGTGKAVLELGRHVAGKTGTTTGFQSAWFAGFTHQQYATVVALYRLDKKGHPVTLDGWNGVTKVYGGTFPARLWTDYMTKVLQDKPDTKFPEPTYGGQDVNVEPSPTGEESPQPQPTQPTQPPQPTQPTQPQPTDTGPPTPSDDPNPQPTWTPPPTRTRTFSPSPDPLPSPSD